MNDREKVIKGLECCTRGDVCISDCPYFKEVPMADGRCITAVQADALAMLKEQEPVIPKEERLNDVDSIYRCGNCGTHFYYRQQKYCAICGRKAKWDG